MKKSILKKKEHVSKTSSSLSIRTTTNRLPDWKKGLIPAIIQNAETGMVLMLGWMNHASLQKTLKTKKVWFYSRSKKRLWMKGEVSKNTLQVVTIDLDCDGDTLLIQAIPAGPTCHTGNKSCFQSKSPTKIPAPSADILSELYTLIDDRKKNMPKKSYTTSLFSKGLLHICAKIYEEAAEVVKAATKETDQRLVEESADLLFHLFVLMTNQGLTLEQLKDELLKRQKA